MTMDYKEVYLIVKEAFEQAGIVFSPDCRPTMTIWY